MRTKRILTMITISIIIGMLFSGCSQISARDSVPSNINTGPYVDKLVYKVINNEDMRYLTLQSGEIDMITNPLNPVYIDYGLDPAIDIFHPVRNGYGQITINCRDYPLNISGLRRAFAFAFDKTAVTVDIMDGFSQEHDSLVPYTNGWCVEDQFDWHYHTNQADIGNQILDDLGFEINPTTGFRHAPNGDPFDIDVWCTTSGFAMDICQVAVDALQELHIDADVEVNDYNQYYPNPIDNHGSYDMVFYATNFDDNDVDWLAYDYWSEYADVDFQNPSNFVNATYDSWRNQLLYSTTYEEVYEAAAEMQKILHYNVPRLVVYENTYLQAYRTDVFTGYVEELGQTITGQWTMRKIHPIDEIFGGTAAIAITSDFDDFNIFHSSIPGKEPILDNLYSSLYKQGPDLNPWPDLATNLIMETHAENPAVPDGHTRFTIDIIQNATWSDGELLTADDVAFTFLYQYESLLFGNLIGSDLSDLTAVYAMNPYRVVLEFGTESYWHFSSFAFDYIIPEHIFNDGDGIGYDGWDTWTPVYSSDPQVTSGPFIFTGYNDETYLEFELTRNPLYYYLDSETPQETNPPPVVISANGINYIEGTTGNEIIWVVSDDNPQSFSIIHDSSVVLTQPWEGSDITYNVDGLTFGTHKFILYLYDASGNIVNSSIIVHVVSALSSTTTPSNGLTLYDIALIGLAAGSFSTMLVAVVWIYRQKKKEVED